MLKLDSNTKLDFYGNLINENIMSREVKDIVEGIIKVTPSVFFVSPTSSSGKYHPKVANGVSGLLKHSVAVMLNAKELLDNDTILNAIGIDSLTSIERDIILSAALLHDNAKYGVEEVEFTNDKLWTKGEHSILVRELAKKAGFTERDEHVEEIITLIDTHMGQWNIYKDDKFKSKELPTPKTPKQVLVHMADYVASKKCLDIVDEMVIPELDEEYIEWFNLQNS